jgi:hypothetical protein
MIPLTNCLLGYSLGLIGEWKLNDLNGGRTFGFDLRTRTYFPQLTPD